MSESNKQLSRRFTELFNSDDVSRADDVLAPDVVFHGLAGGDLDGIEAVKAFIAAYRAAFPDAVSTIEDHVSEGDRVVCRWHMRATHLGPLGDLPATGRTVDTGGITIERYAGGRLAEVWVARDELGMLRQLGAIAEAEPTVAA